MYSNSKLCTVCLQSDSELIDASQTDSNNVKWSCKLEFCVPEVEWDEYCLICSTCTEQLDAACSFRNLCLQSNGSHIQLQNGKNQRFSVKKDEELKKSSRSKSKKIEFKCYICSRTFPVKSALAKHIESHSKNCCELCKENFTTSTQLQLHKVQLHSKSSEDSSECRFCSRSFKSPVSLNQHIKRMHGKESCNLDTSHCSNDNDSVEMVHVHDTLKLEDYIQDNMKMEDVCSISEDKFKLHSNYDSFSNDFDNDCFNPEAEHSNLIEQGSNVNLTSDYSSHNPISDCSNYNPTSDYSNHNSTSDNSNHNPTSDCSNHNSTSDNSNQNPSSDSVIESKQKNKTETKSQRKARAKFFCEECKSVFASSKKLLDHAVGEHGYDPSIIKPFGCDKCDSKFSSSSNLLQHKKYHVGKRTHICTFCGKGYITKSDLNTHEKQHLNKREYQCLSCPKTFNTHKDLRSHRLVVHTDPSLWNYVCTFCQKRFPIKSNLDQHMRRHTGEKRFGCHICDKRFVDKIVMQKHIKSHSNFRAFKCEHCEKEYKDSKVLEIHLTKVHGIGNAKIPVRVKKHFCHVCPKSYFAKNKLTRHMFSHTGEKPYICHICERKFTDKSYVKQHLRTTHNVFDVDENK